MTTDLTQKGFMAYMADAIIAYIRAGHLPTEEAADYMNRFPLIGEFRARITEEDLPWLIEVVRRESRMVGAYCLSLLQRYDQRDDVKTFLRSRWETADAFFRAQLIWRLLDDPDLPQEWHRKLFNFVLAEWEAFRDSQVRFMGPQEDALTNCLIRISDPDFTASKKWAYLCAAAAAGKRAGAMALVKTIHDEPWRYLDSKDQFVFTFMQEVTEALLKLLAQEAG